MGITSKKADAPTSTSITGEGIMISPRVGRSRSPEKKSKAVLFGGGCCCCFCNHPNSDNITIMLAFGLPNNNVDVNVNDNDSGVHSLIPNSGSTNSNGSWKEPAAVRAIPYLIQVAKPMLHDDDVESRNEEREK